jgi:hypothetical protein
MVVTGVLVRAGWSFERTEITEYLPVILVHPQLLLFLVVLDVLEDYVVEVDCI